MNRPARRPNAPQAAVDCAACPLRPLEAFVPMSAREVEFMRSFKAGELAVSRGTLIFEQGVESANLFTLLEGFAIRYTTLPDGRRQVFNFLFKGELLGLQGAPNLQWGLAVFHDHRQATVKQPR